MSQGAKTRLPGFRLAGAPVQGRGPAWLRKAVMGGLLVLFVLWGSGPREWASGAPGLSDLSLKYRESVQDVGPLQRRHGRFRIRLEAEIGQASSISTIGIELGAITASVPLEHGRFRGRLESAGGPLRAIARTFGSKLVCTIRGAFHGTDGSVFGSRYMDGCTELAYWDGMLHGLHRAVVTLDQTRLEGGIGVVGKSERRATNAYTVALGGVGAFPANQDGSPRVQLVRERSGSPWNGRIRGSVVSVGEAPTIALAARRTSSRMLAPASTEALGLGDGTMTVDSLEELAIEGATVYQACFDAAVPERDDGMAITIEGIVNVGRTVLRVRPPDPPPPDPPVAFAMESHVLELRAQGQVWSWGDNTFGQVGDGTKLDPAGPKRIEFQAPIVGVVAGSGFSVAIDALGTLWRWGKWAILTETSPGVYVGHDLSTVTPEVISGFPPVVDMAAGYDHVLAIDRKGQVWAAGSNLMGQLGDGTIQSRPVRPVRIRGLPTMVRVAAGYRFSIALDEHGGVWAWGDHQLADVIDPAVPMLVAGLPHIADIRARLAAIALASDGTVWGWRNNHFGQLGDGTNTDRNVPVRVVGLDGIVSIDAGGFHTVAVRKDGTVWAWGLNIEGELGDGTSTDRLLPVRVRDLQDIVSIGAGSFTSMAVDRSGRAWVWGLANTPGTIGWRRGSSGVYPILEKRETAAGNFRAARISVLNSQDGQGVQGSPR